MQRVLWVLKKIPLQQVKLVRFLLSGGVGVVLNIIMLWGFTELLHLWYLLSLIISVIISSALNFMLQKFWTFDNQSLEHVHKQVPQFVMLAIANLILNSIFLYVLVEYVHLWYLASQVICIATLSTMNFFMYHTFIFSNRER